MSSQKNVKAKQTKGLISSFLGSVLYIPIGLLPKVMFQLYALPGVFLNAMQENLSLKWKYIPAVVIAGIAYFGFNSPLAATLVLLASALLGLFNMFYKSGHGLFKSGAYTVLPVAGLLILALQWIFQKMNFNSELISTFALWELMQLKLPENILLTEYIKMSYLKELSFLYPASIMVFCCFVIFTALIFEKKLFKTLFNKASKKGDLSYFKVPDNLVWVALVSGAVAFINHEVLMAKYVAQNVFFVCATLYYFQGFAILFNFFKVFKVGMLTKLLMVFCLALSLVHVTMMMGFLDYWYNFRARFLKRATQVNERRNL